MNDRDRPDRASAVILAPVAVVIVLFLASICVDATALFLARRSLSDIAAAAANDAAGAAFDAEAFTHEGIIRIDPVRARRIALVSVEAHVGQLPGPIDVTVTVHETGDPDTPVEVIVRLTTRVSAVVLPRSDTIAATAAAAPILESAS